MKATRILRRKLRKTKRMKGGRRTRGRKQLNKRGRRRRFSKKGGRRRISRKKRVVRGGVVGVEMEMPKLPDRTAEPPTAAAAAAATADVDVTDIASVTSQGAQTFAKEVQKKRKKEAAAERRAPPGLWEKEEVDEPHRFAVQPQQRHVKIEAQKKGGRDDSQWYPGEIVPGSESSGHWDVRYDDGEYGMEVGPWAIRPRPTNVPTAKAMAAGRPSPFGEDYERAQESGAPALVRQMNEVASKPSTRATAAPLVIELEAAIKAVKALAPDWKPREYTHIGLAHDPMSVATERLTLLKGEALTEKQRAAAEQKLVEAIAAADGAAESMSNTQRKTVLDKLENAMAAEANQKYLHGKPQSYAWKMEGEVLEAAKARVENLEAAGKQKGWKRMPDGGKGGTTVMTDGLLEGIRREMPQRWYYHPTEGPSHSQHRSEEWKQKWLDRLYNQRIGYPDGIRPTSSRSSPRYSSYSSSPRRSRSPLPDYEEIGASGFSRAEGRF